MSNSLPPKKQAKPLPDASQIPEQDERDHYSIDDIMDALRDSAREKEDTGEIVTRADGTTARKVRRRKRRSNQPESARKSTKEKKEAKKKRSLILKISAVVALLLLALLGTLFIIVRFNSSAYLAEVEDKASDWVGGSAKFEGLKLYPGSIAMNRAYLSWEDGYFIKDLELKKIAGHTGFVNYLGGKMGGTELGSARGVMNLQMPESGVKLIQTVPPEDFPFDFQRYFCDGLDINLGSSDFMSVSGVKASLRFLVGTGWQLHLDDGLLNLKGWESFPLDLGIVRFKGDKIELSSVVLKQPEGMETSFNSTLQLAGHIPLKPGAPVSLKIEKGGVFPIQGLVGKNLARFFSGRTRTIEHDNSQIEFTFGESVIDSVTVPFRADHVILSRFPFMRDLKEILGDQIPYPVRFEQEARGVFRWLPEGMGLANLDISHEEFLRLEGNVFAAHDGRLGGNLRLKISTGLLRSSPEYADHPKLMANVVGGYATFDIKIGGTVDDPLDDFRLNTGLDTIPRRKGMEPLKGFDHNLEDIFQQVPSNRAPSGDAGLPDAGDFDRLTNPDNPFQDNTGEN